MSDINWFFQNPRSVPRPGGLSQLYLLRRDIDTCFGTDPNTGGRIVYEAIWPGTMAILAGIDLLGKFLAGTDKGEVGKRFTNFVTRYLGLTKADGDIIYQLRNSLLHSFGLYSEKSDHKGNVVATYNFTLSRGAGMLAKHLNDDYYLVDVQCLRELFEQAVEKYEMELRDTSRQDYQDLNKKFSVMLSKHAKPMLVFSI